MWDERVHIKSGNFDELVVVHSVPLEGCNRTIKDVKVLRGTFDLGVIIYVIVKIQRYFLGRNTMLKLMY